MLQAIAMTANAQESDEADKGIVLANTDEIVVTALKREQNLQDVPASISVFSSEVIDAFEIDSIRDISRLTPNFLATSFSNVQPIFAIRGGANTLGALGTNEPVAVFIDEIFVPRFSAGDLELFDLESVEVLRGPQGTFFGRNVAAGAIILNTAKPSLEEITAKAQASYGNFNAYEARGLVNGPITDNIAAKFSVSRFERDGFASDTITGQEQEGVTSTSLRGALLYSPDDQFEAIFSIDYSRDTNTGRTLSSISVADDGDRRTSTVGTPQNFEREIFGASLRLSYEIDAGELLSITGFRKSNSREVFSFNGLSFTLLPFGFQQLNQEFEDPQTFSQEFRFVSNEDNRFSYIAGLFFLNEDSEAITARQRLGAGTGAFVANELFFQVSDTNAYAAYFDGTYALTDKIDISGGVRYTFEEREASLEYIDLVQPDDSFIGANLSEGFDAFTPRGVITYRPTDDLTLFASISRGFTAGGFNTTDDSLAEFEQPFAEETIRSIEVGLKSVFADGAGYFNVTGFRQRFNDKQEFVFNPTTFFGTVVNAADARIQGVEVEAGFRFNEYFGIDATYGFLDTEFLSFPIGDGPGNTGNQLGNAPRHQYSISGNGFYPISNHIEAFFNASWGFTDEYFSGATNDPDLFVESFGLLNATAGFRSADDRWRFEFFGSNLLNTEFVLIPSDFFVTAEQLGPPRFYGGRITVAY